MKKGRIKVFITSLLTFSMIFTTAVYAKTDEDKNFIIEGNAEGLVTIPNEEEFLVKENMVPGDSAYGTITLENNYDYPYRVYLRAEDYENNTDLDLVEKLNLNLSIGERDIYKGDLHAQEGLSEEVLIWSLDPGEKLIIDAKVTLDGSTGNEYKNKYASVKWIFTAIRDIEDPLIDPDEDPVEDPLIEPDKPLIDNIVEPLKDIIVGVKTGDATSILKLIGILALSGGIVVVLIRKRGDNVETK